jgi:hypothetical protein
MEINDEIKKSLIVKGRSFDGKIPEIICYKDDKLPFCERVKFNLRKGKSKCIIDHKIELIEDEIRDQKTVIKEAIELIKEQKCVQLALRTGFGKSIVGLYLASKLNKKTLFIVESIMVKQGFISTFKKVLNGSFQIIESDTKEIKENVCIAMIQTLKNVDLSIFSDFGTIIVDENITFCTQKRINILLDLDPLYMIGMCADTIREDGLHKALYHFFGPRNKFIIRKSNIDFTVTCLRTPFVAEIKKTWQGKIDFNTIINSLAFNEKRNNLIIDIIKLHYYYKMIVFCKRKEQCQILYDKCKSLNLDAQILIGSTRNINNCQVLITTLSKCNRGFDDQNTYINHDGQRIQLAIYASSVKNPEQSIGRAFRSQNPYGIYLLDDNSILRNHWKSCATWFISRKAKILQEYLL